MYVKKVFDSGRVELGKSQEASNTIEKDDREDGKTGLNTFKLNVLTNAICVDILVWAAREEAGTGLTCNKMHKNATTPKKTRDQYQSSTSLIHEP